MREERRGRKGVVNDQGDKFSLGAVGGLFSRLVLLHLSLQKFLSFGLIKKNI